MVQCKHTKLNELFFTCITAGNLTIKALYSLVYVLKDHKTKPNSKKLMTIVPVSQCMLLNILLMPSNNGK